MKASLLIICLLFITACATQFKQSSVKKLNPGMTKEEVIKIMGEPGDRQFSGNKEVLQWCNTGMSGDAYIMAHFRDGKLGTVQRYSQTLEGNCTDFFNQVNFN